jgi:hypothetical protein
MSVISYRLFVVIGLTMVLLGCMHHMTQDECLFANWYKEGMQDGQNGFQRSLDREIQDCAKCNVTVDVEQYMAGWRQGIRDYCTPETGFALGSAGIDYPCFCPPDLAGDFKVAWYHGIKCFYTPERGCGAGCNKTYYSPPIECGCVEDDIGVPKGCPCTIVN